jgi:hypothetical protein
MSLKDSLLSQKTKYFVQGAGIALAVILIAWLVIETVRFFYGSETAFETAKAIYFLMVGFFFGNAYMAGLEARKAQKKLNEILKAREEALR